MWQKENVYVKREVRLRVIIIINNNIIIVINYYYYYYYFLNIIIIITVIIIILIIITSGNRDTDVTVYPHFFYFYNLFTHLYC